MNLSTVLNCKLYKSFNRLAAVGDVRSLLLCFFVICLIKLTLLEPSFSHLILRLYAIHKPLALPRWTLVFGSAF